MKKASIFLLLLGVFFLQVGMAYSACPSGEQANYICPSGFTLSSDKSTCYASPICPEGSTYVSSRNRCETQPSSGETKCDLGWTYDMSNNVCYVSATCPSGSTLQNGKCKTQPTVTCQSPNSGNYNLSGYWCFKTTDNGDTITDHEQCYSVSGGELCPIDMQRCTATYTNATCPSGGTLNTTLHKCTAQPNPTCPSGYTYDSSIDRCTAPAQCPNGGSLNPYTNKCEIVVTSSLCPSGYTYNTTYEACIKTPTCPSGGTYNPSRDRCEYQVTKSCPSGYTYNSSKDDCEATPQCPSGTSYNTTYNTCITQPHISCPQGYTYNSATGRCETTTFYCPKNAPYNPVVGECEEKAESDAVTCVAIGTVSLNDNYYTEELCLEVNPVPIGNTAKFRIYRYLNGANGNSNYSYGSWVSFNSSGGSTCSIQDFTSIDHYNATLYHQNGYFWVSGGKKISMSEGGISSGIIYTDYDSGGSIEVFGVQIKNYKIRIGYLDYFCYSDCPTTTKEAENAALRDFSDSATAVTWTAVTWTDWIPFYEPYCPTQYLGISYPYKTCSTWGYTHNPWMLYAFTFHPLRNNECQALPACLPISAGCSGPSSFVYGQYDISKKVCYAGNSGATCPSGTSYDSSINYCTASATCSDGGSLNTSTDKCQISVTNECPSNYTYDSSTNICYSSPICNYGYYDSSINECRLSAASVCPSGYTFNSSSDKCLESPQCQSPGVYSDTLNKCGTSPNYNCSTGYSYDSTNRLCESNPQCPPGDNFDTSNNECYEGNLTCPYGSGHACLPYNGKNYCSPYDCVNMSTAQTTTQQANLSSYTNDGRHDSDGNCLGTIYIFNGKGQECRTAGVKTMFTNCCSKAYKKQGKILFVLPQCNKTDAKTDQFVQSGVCHYVGEYCSWKLKFPKVCLQHKKVYCCFHSKLGRIIQEQGRPQLKDFGYSGDWGDPTNPNCRGFTADEFQMLDFNKMDLSSYFGDITKKVAGKQKEIEQKARQNINNFYNQTKSPTPP